MIKDTPPLKLTVDRWIDKDEEADLLFEVAHPILQSAEMELRWGPGARQARRYLLPEADLEELHAWIGRVLGREES